MKSLILSLICVLSLASCGGGGGSSSLTPAPEATPTPVVTPEPKPTEQPGDTPIYGYITFDRIPHDNKGGLLYDSPEAMPVRGATVEFRDTQDSVIRRATTDANGYYELGAPPSTRGRVVVLAQIQKTGAPGWAFEVVDNNGDDAVYTLVGDLSTTGSDAEQRDLHAASGWNSSTGDFDDPDMRPAAPFAILDTAYQAAKALTGVDASLSLPRCQFGWSTSNTYDRIGTTYYDTANKRIEVLGDGVGDNDEYDYSVILHELAHFLEDTLSRSDSIGGSHPLGGSLDMRLAYSEGLANAFASIVSGDVYYKDSAGSAGLVIFNLEQPQNKKRGWYNELSISSLLYDLADDTNEPGDSLSLGLQGIYDVMTASSYIETDVFSSIFLFRDVFDRQRSNSEKSAFSQLLSNEGIYGENRYAFGEANSGGLAFTLPVYRSLSLGGTASVCSTNEFGEYNALGVNGYVYFSVAQSGNYSLEVTRTSDSSLTATDPDVYLYRNGELVDAYLSDENNRERINTTLQAGTYVLEIYEASFVDDNPTMAGVACFNVTVN